MQNGLKYVRLNKYMFDRQKIEGKLVSAISISYPSDAYDFSYI
jgi:hypothetical protein